MPVSTTSSGKFVGKSCHKLIRNCESLFMPTFEKAIGNAAENRFVENRFEVHLEIICESFFMPAFEKAIGNAVENRFVENVVEIASMNCDCGIRLEVSSCLPPGRDEAR